MILHKMEPLFIKHLQNGGGESFSKCVDALKPHIKYSHIQAWWSFISACVALYAVYYPVWLDISCYNLLAYMTIDYFFVAIDMKIHHAISAACIVNHLVGQIPTDHAHFIYKTIYRTEYSTIFLSGMNIAGTMVSQKYKSVVKYAGFAGFSYTFVKYRIASLGSQLVFNPHAYAMDIPIWSKMVVMFSWLGFYALNSYWFCKILKKVYNLTCRNTSFNRVMTSEWLSQYSLVPLCCVSVIPLQDAVSSAAFVPALIHSIGAIILIWSSYSYHSYALNRVRIEGENFNLFGGNGADMLYYDTASIHFGTFCLFVSAVYNIQQTVYEFATEIVFMGAFCFACSVKIWNHITLISHRSMPFTKVSDERRIVYYYLMVPQMLNSFLSVALYAKVHPVEYCVALFFKYAFAYWFMTWTFILNPFDQLNHLNVHVSTILLNYIAANEISRMSRIQ